MGAEGESDVLITPAYSSHAYNEGEERTRSRLPRAFSVFALKCPCPVKLLVPTSWGSPRPSPSPGETGTVGPTTGNNPIRYLPLFMVRTRSPGDFKKSSLGSHNPNVYPTPSENKGHPLSTTLASSPARPPWKTQVRKTPVGDPRYTAFGILANMKDALS